MELVAKMPKIRLHAFVSVGLGITIRLQVCDITAKFHYRINRIIQADNERVLAMNITTSLYQPGLVPVLGKLEHPGI